MIRTLFIGLVAFTFLPQAAQDRPAIRRTATIEMPDVEGRIDHLAADIEGRRLFVAALGNNTVEVLDLASHRVVRSLTGLHEPQGIRFLQDRKRAVVANGGDGATVFFDGSTLAPWHTTPLSGDADNVRYDQKAGRVYVGFGDGALGVLDSDGAVLARIALDAHPEAFQLETNGPRIFVNVPSANQIAIVDREKRAVVSKWPVIGAAANYPMALDEAAHRLLIGCRRPAKVLVYDTGSGTATASFDIPGDTDDLFFDATTKRLFVIGGEGFISVFEQDAPDRYRQIQKLPTAAGARTGLFVPELNQIFLAVPHRGNQGAAIWIYDVAK